MLFAIAFGLSHWINNSERAHKNPPLAAVEQPDPVAELRGIIDECKGQYITREFTGWDYDVKKNASLVKPYLGTVRYLWPLSTGSHSEWVNFLCYEEGRWKAVGSKHRFNDGEWTEADVSMLSPSIDRFYTERQLHNIKP